MEVLFQSWKDGSHENGTQKENLRFRHFSNNHHSEAMFMLLRGVQVSLFLKELFFIPKTKNWNLNESPWNEEGNIF